MTRRARQWLGVRGEMRHELWQAAWIMARLQHPRAGYASARLHRIGAEVAAELAALGACPDYRSFQM